MEVGSDIFFPKQTFHSEVISTFEIMYFLHFSCYKRTLNGLLYVWEARSQKLN